jgi:hypothetical protein
MKLPKIDASIVCFALVVVAAIPVAALRSSTYTLGYDLGKLKNSERLLRQRNVELKSTLAQTQRTLRERFVSGRNNKSKDATLELPSRDRILDTRNAGEK